MRRQLTAVTSVLSQKLCHLRNMYLVILTAALLKVTLSHKRHPSIQPTSKCHIYIQFCWSWDNSMQPHTSIQNTGIHFFLILAVTQSQHCLEVSNKIPIFRRKLGFYAYSFSLLCPRQFQPLSPGLWYQASWRQLEDQLCGWQTAPENKSEPNYSHLLKCFIIKRWSHDRLEMEYGRSAKNCKTQYWITQITREKEISVRKNK